MTAGVDIHLSYPELIVLVFLLAFGLLRELMHLVRSMGDELLHFLEWFAKFRKRLRALRLPEGYKRQRQLPVIDKRRFAPDVDLDRDRLPSKVG